MAAVLAPRARVDWVCRGSRNLSLIATAGMQACTICDKDFANAGTLISGV